MDVLHAAGMAVLIVLDPHRLMLLFLGVSMGLAIGILPGIGGVAGTAMLLPFTYGMDPASAMALLLGLGASTTTADPISAIVLGAPGHSASAATALDGFPMTRRGEGARALGAAYMSAMMGGLFGAALMGLVLPIMRPLILLIGSPELFALALVGLSMVAVLSGSRPLRGITCACFGLMLAMVGSSPQTGTLRWTLGSLYLWDGLPLVPVTLGIFALPELCDLMISRTAAVQSHQLVDSRNGLLQGAQDCFKHWFLVLRCSSLGATMGAIPGIGAAVIDWLSYGHALRTEKGAAETFGTGDVRGVIAAESATCSREGGALIPTVVFGVPASSGMAILLGAFLMHGLVPGPDMVGRNLPITYAMVWSIAIANLLGSGLCFAFSGRLARLSTLRYTVVLPVVLCLVYIGAFEGKRDWGDLYSLLVFGVLGWVLKHLQWPRPPLVLGYILGGPLERYLFISIERYGASWLLRPAVIVLLLFAASSLLRPAITRWRKGGRGVSLRFGRPHWAPASLFPITLLLLFALMMSQALGWDFGAAAVPVIVGAGAMLACTAALVTEVFAVVPSEGGIAGRAKAQIAKAIHLDVKSTTDHLPTRTVLARGAGFFGWMIAFLGCMAGIGLIPTVPAFMIAFMRFEGRERWRLILPMTAITTLFIYVLFDRLLGIQWPTTLLGHMVPALKGVVPSV